MSAVDDVLAGVKAYDVISKNNADSKARNLANSQAQIQADSTAAQRKALEDPNSAESKITKTQGLAYLQGLAGTGLYKDNRQPLDDLINTIQDPTTSGYQVKNIFETSPIMKSITGLGEAQAKAQGMIPLAQSRMAGVENQKDRIAASAGDHFDKDPILTKINKQKQQVDLDRHTLETAQTLTPQIVNEIQQGIANAISGGGSAGLGKTEQTEIQTASQKLAELRQKMTSDPTAINNPELVQYFHGVLSRLGDAYDRNGYSRAQQIFKGRAQGYRSNPAAISVMQDKMDSYKPSDAVNPYTGGTGSAKQPPNGAMTVKQNGHTYNWNSDTGQYE